MGSRSESDSRRVRSSNPRATALFLRTVLSLRVDRREYFKHCTNNVNTHIDRMPDLFLARFLGHERRRFLKLPRGQCSLKIGRA